MRRVELSSRIVFTKPRKIVRALILLSLQSIFVVFFSVFVTKLEWISLKLNLFTCSPTSRAP